MKIKSLDTKFRELALEAKTLSCRTKLNYCVEKNAGDSFNKFFLKDYFGVCIGKKTILPSEHYLFCGSVLGRSDANSIVIGAGFISKEASISRFKQIHGVRGQLTLQKIKGKISTQEVFLADPGLLIKEILPPRISSYTERGCVGIIPHFIDYKLANEMLRGEGSIKVIDITRNYKDVGQDILACDYIVSSSLHGLIFSDALNVPNSWVQLSDNVVGGDFKFRDYYSTCDGEKKPIRCDTVSSVYAALELAFVSNAEQYEEMKKRVVAEFSKHA
ncbi:polysaccharide pyruvyl transferase family protein [Stutzerimonas stutzeri]|uniref:polysaccharide pyruvyl transferase family protein n=1 Tax=Stutzerimonas stutzeri TaxID=316 RepID=UPI0031D908A0